jgi:hypothetical protein
LSRYDGEEAVFPSLFPSVISYQLSVTSYQLPDVSFQSIVLSDKFGAYSSLITVYSSLITEKPHTPSTVVKCPMAQNIRDRSTPP